MIDTTQAHVTNVTSPAADGTYIVGQSIDVAVQFDKPVFVTNTPSLLQLGWRCDIPQRQRFDDVDVPLHGRDRR